MDTLNYIACPECSGLMVLDDNPIMFKCRRCSFLMLIDDVKGIEEDLEGFNYEE